MLTTNYLPGTPVWVDLGSPDVPATIAFYTTLFGWSHESMSADPGGYGVFRHEGKTVAGVGPLTEQGAGPAWTLYFCSADADATTKAVEQAGGTVRMPPSDIDAEGRMAHFTDPGGAEFAIWQPGRLKGLDLVTETGSLCWTELYVADPAAARAFYRSVFDWKVEEMPMGDMTYTVVGPSEGDADSGMGGILPLGSGGKAQWLPYFEVSDCDTTVARTRQLGGKVLAPPDSMEGVGRFATLTDPHGTPFAVITSSS